MSAPGARSSIFSGRRLAGRSSPVHPRTSAGFDDVGAADKIGDEPRARPLVDFLGVADLLDPSVIEDGDPVGHRQRFALVVRDEDEGEAERVLQGLQLALHRLAQFQVERAERLVEQQNFRAQDERARQRHALALAAGQFARPSRFSMPRSLTSFSASTPSRWRSEFATPRIISP